jgi:hypothetical protein
MDKVYQIRKICQKELEKYKNGKIIKRKEGTSNI